MLNSKIDRYEKLFGDLLENDSVKKYEKELQHSVDKMRWWRKNVFTRREYKRKVETREKVREIRDDSLDKARLNIARWSEHLAGINDAGLEQSVLYYRDQDGKGEIKAYYTSDWQLQE